MDPNEVNNHGGDDATITVRVGRHPHRSILHAHGHAEEDLGFLSSLSEESRDLRHEFKTLTLTPTAVSIPVRLDDSAFNALGAAWGKMEQLPEMQRFLSRLPYHAYTFVVHDGILARGSRPDPGKLQNLAGRGGYGTTINLCKEMVDGDTSLIEQARLSDVMHTAHIPITDNTPPKVQQVLHFLDLVSSRDRRDNGKPIYVHCEAGVGRTGVMVACYRMAVMGWDPQNALQEAKNFGCTLPDQQAFIAGFGERLRGDKLESYVHAADYPLLPIGSAHPQDTSVLLKNLTTDAYAAPEGRGTP